MRKLAFINFEDITVKKIMLCPADNGTVYLFAYDTPYDTPCSFDEVYFSIQEAQNYCEETFNITADDWIEISPLQEGCQQDFTAPVRVKGRANNNPLWGTFEVFKDNKWQKYTNPNKAVALNTLSLEDRLSLCGLTGEFNEAQKNNLLKAAKILKALQFDLAAIKQILDG